MYLRIADDLKMSETGYKSSDSEPPRKKSQVESDQMLARQLQIELDKESDGESQNVPSRSESLPLSTQSASSRKSQENDTFNSCASLILSLRRAVNKNKQFFIVVRMGSTLNRPRPLWICNCL